MKTLIPCELRDLDGSYVLVEPVGEIRCRVLVSNVARKGEVLYKPEALTWSQASRDLGGFTRLSPAELLGTVEADSRPDPENLLEVLGSQEEILGDARRPDPEGDVVDPETLPGRGGTLEADDPRAEQLRLASKERKAGRSRSARVA